MRWLTPIVIAAMLFAAGCSQPTPAVEGPEWIAQKIEEFRNAPVGNPPQSIWRYEYEGQTVYYVPAQCCDMFSTLYDADGNVVCAPDGGLDGRGDGSCPDFREERTEEQLIWEDPRTR